MKNMEEKHFDKWMEVKSSRHFRGECPIVKEGQIWWCAIGENVGIEINGKSEFFSRPIIIVKKLSRYGFLAVPLTSQKHEGSWYANFVFKDKTQYAALSQMRVMSAARLYRRIGTVPKSDLDIVVNGIKKLYFE